MHQRNLHTIVTATLLFAAGAVLAQASLHSPAEVSAALGTLNRVVNHTQRLITAKNYIRLPHENEEFKEGADALEKAVVDEPSDFKNKVRTKLDQARKGSQSVADAAAEHDDSALGLAHRAFADSVQAVLEVFPNSVRPAISQQPPHS